MKEGWITRILFNTPQNVRDLRTQTAVQGWILSASILALASLLLHKNYGWMLLMNVLLTAYGLARSKQLMEWADKLDEGIRIVVEKFEEMGESLETLGEKPTEKGD